jgi:acyl-CoA thioester hydrolase
MGLIYETQVLWSQIDANAHLRHSAYADIAAQARISMLEETGLKFSIFEELKIGPILFREELLYLREIKINDHIKVVSVLTKSRPDGSRWSIRHEIYRSDGIKSAIVNVDGAWIDIEKRKLTNLPEEYAKVFMSVPKSEDYQESK